MATPWMMRPPRRTAKLGAAETMAPMTKRMIALPASLRVGIHLTRRPKSGRTMPTARM